MKVNELIYDKESSPLLEGRRLDIYEALIPLLTITEENGGGDGGGGGEGGESSPGDGGTPKDVVPDPPPVTPPGYYGWFRTGPGMGPVYGGLWFNQLYSTVKNLTVATNILKRLKALNIKGEGAKRVKQAQKTAAKHVRLLLSNPGATAYRIPVWTTNKPPKQLLKVWNEAFALEFQKELNKIPTEIL